MLEKLHVERVCRILVDLAIEIEELEKHGKQISTETTEEPKAMGSAERITSKPRTRRIRSSVNQEPSN